MAAKNPYATPTSQQEATPTISGGHPAAPQVIPGPAGNRPTPSTASVTGDTPVYQAYKHN